MVADVPVGVLLSGGLDSSLIVALLADEGQRDLATFSVGFEAEGGEEGDEFRYSDLVARHFGTDHHQLMVPSDRVSTALDAAIEAMSEPMVSHDVVAFHLLSEQVAKEVKVVQSGQGADEVFAGYHWYPDMAAVPRERAPEAYAETYFDRSHADLARILRPDMLPDHDVSGRFVREHMARPGAETALDAALRLDTEVMLVDDPVKRVDNMTMDWGLEARVPFLDHDLVELAAACPPELKLADGGKGVLKGRRTPGPALGGRRPAQGLLPGPRRQAHGGPRAGAGPRGSVGTRGQVTGRLPGRVRGQAAVGARRAPHQAWGERAVAGSFAGDMAANPRNQLTGAQGTRPPRPATDAPSYPPTDSPSPRPRRRGRRRRGAVAHRGPRRRHRR